MYMYVKNDTIFCASKQKLTKSYSKLFYLLMQFSIQIL